MAPTEMATLPTAECQVDEDVDKKPNATQLVVMSPKAANSPTWTIERTLRYTQDPKGYLIQQLGETVFEERRSMLCVPEEIDKDFYGTGKHKSNFEQHIAKLLGKDHGLFFITGVQAQLAALKVYCDRVSNNRVGWHASSHLESAERDAYHHLYRLNRIQLGNDPESNPTVDEIKEILSRPETDRPAAILLEIPNRTLGFSTYTYEELETISRECRRVNVKLHCDGARLWDIEPYYQATAGKSLAGISALFDSVYVSFYKGLGGAGGAMLLSNDSDLIDQAKIWQRRNGGNVFTLFYNVIDCERGFNEKIGTFERQWKKMIDVVDGVSKATKKFTSKDGVPYVHFVKDPPTCCQSHTIFEGFTAEELIAARDRVEQKMNVRVFERLRPKQKVDQRPKKEKLKDQTEEKPDNRHYMEWYIQEDNEDVETQVFVDAYVALCEELEKTAASVT